MSQFNYEKSRAVATKLLNKFGGGVVVEKPDAETFDAIGVILSVEAQDRPNTLTDTSVYKLLLEYTDSFQPEVGDYAQVGATKWAIRMVEPLQPDGVTNVFNTCYVSK